jgi:hypothetical protein
MLGIMGGALQGSGLIACACLCLQQGGMGEG